MDQNAVDVDALYPELSEQCRELEADCRYLRTLRIEGSSADELVTVTVDGLGALVDLRLDPESLRQTTPSAVGSCALEALRSARTAAAEAAMAEMTETALVS